MTLQEYREVIIATLLSNNKAKDKSIITEAQARDLLAELTDEELEEGMLFNTPEDVANLLLEIGKL